MQGSFTKAIIQMQPRTWGVGEISAEAQRLIDVTRESFFKGISFAKEGNHLHEISAAIQDYVEGTAFQLFVTL